MKSSQADKGNTAAARSLEDRVWMHVKNKNIKQATADCERLTREFPDFASGWHTASQLALQLKNPELALNTINRALAIVPDSTAWLLQKAVCLSRLGRIEQLESLVQQLLRKKMATAYQCSTFGLLLTRLGLRQEAVSQYTTAISLEPNDARHYYNAASLQRTLGDIDAAERNFNKAIGLSPMDYEAYKLRSELRKQTQDSNHVEALEQLLDAGIDDQRGQVLICYTLAKELEDMHAWERSFRYLKMGADTRRSYMQYDVQRDLDTIAAVKQTYVPELFDGSIRGDDNAEAIFVLGMPRTGTTLVERILSSHTDVFAAGELNNFSLQMMGQVKEKCGGKAIPRDEMVNMTTSLDFTKLGSAYIKSTRPFTGHTARFIDKLPLNYLYVGLIHLALPNAKIIVLERDPLDTCYAIYKQLFVDAYPFSYKLDELAQYFVAYHELMQHWKTVMPDNVHTVCYEDLVSDIESESRRLIDICDLEWQPQCLEFYENKQASTTASSVQIRQPVYKTSIGKWRNFEQQMQAVVDILQRAGIATST